MKELFEKTFNNKNVKTILIGLTVFLIFTFIVFPGLTVADTILNIISALIGIFTLVFLFYYIDGDKFFNTPTIEPGETELDYIPKEEIVKKKSTKKKKDESHIIHPKVNKTKIK